MAHVVCFDAGLVRVEAIERAAYALAAVMTLDVTRQGDAGETLACTIHPLAPQADEEPLAHRLRREVNDQAIRLKLEEQTSELRNLIFAVAYSKTGLVSEILPE